MTPADHVLERRDAALASARLRPSTAPELVPSYSNDAWLVDDPEQGAVVLRICWRGDPARLLREAAVGRALPATVRYPPVLAAGGVPNRPWTWVLTRRLPGQALGAVWRRLSPAERDVAARDIAGMLRALHRFRPDAALAALILPAPLPDAPTVDEVVGRAMNPWPDGVTLLLGAAREHGAPAALVAEAAALLRRDAYLAPELDGRAEGVVHGDLHLQNVLAEGGRVTGLLDLEFVRRAPPWVDLARLADQVDEDALEGVSAHAELVEGLRRWYPELFAVDGLGARLRLLRVAYQLRQLAIQPARAGELSPDHPVRQLEALLGMPAAAAQEAGAGSPSA